MNDVVEELDQVLWYRHDPRYFAFIQDFDVGADNISVTNCSD